MRKNNAVVLEIVKFTIVTLLSLAEHVPKRSFKRLCLLRRIHSPPVVRCRAWLLAMAGYRRQRASTRDPEYEAQMELAVKDVAHGTHKTINVAMKARIVAFLDAPR